MQEIDCHVEYVLNDILNDNDGSLGSLTGLWSIYNCTETGAQELLPDGTDTTRGWSGKSQHGAGTPCVQWLQEEGLRAILRSWVPAAAFMVERWLQPELGTWLECLQGRQTARLGCWQLQLISPLLMAIIVWVLPSSSHIRCKNIRANELHKSFFLWQIIYRLVSSQVLLLSFLRNLIWPNFSVIRKMWTLKQSSYLEYENTTTHTCTWSKWFCVFLSGEEAAGISHGVFSKQCPALPWRE